MQLKGTGSYILWQSLVALKVPLDVESELVKFQHVLLKASCCFGFSSRMTYASVMKKINSSFNLSLYLQQLPLVLAPFKMVCAVVPLADRTTNPVTVSVLM